VKIQLNLNQLQGFRTFVGMKWLRKLFFPLVPIYYLGALINKKLFDWNIRKSKTYDLPIITVGNLSVGGTGKSPMVAYLIDLLQKEIKVAVLSRGYKRKTKGFQLVTKNSTALEVGDEPLQFKLNFPKATIAVDAERRNGIEKLIKSSEKPNAIILDDAFQHRKVKAGLQLLLTSYDDLYVNDCMLPIGNLREPKSGSERANVIIVTKCPEALNIDQRIKISTSLKVKSYQNVFFTYIEYDSVVKNKTQSISVDEYLKDKFTLVTGIANPKPLVDYLTLKQVHFKHLSFQDHHNFSKNQIEKLSKEGRILTTEKDFMRLKNFSLLKGKLFYIPIKSSFIEDRRQFEEIILNYCK